MLKFHLFYSHYFSTILCCKGHHYTLCFVCLFFFLMFFFVHISYNSFFLIKTHNLYKFQLENIFQHCSVLWLFYYTRQFDEIIRLCFCMHSCLWKLLMLFWSDVVRYWDGEKQKNIEMYWVEGEHFYEMWQHVGVFVSWFFYFYFLLKRIHFSYVKHYYEKMFFCCCFIRVKDILFTFKNFILVIHIHYIYICICFVLCFCFMRLKLLILK